MSGGRAARLWGGRWFRKYRSAGPGPRLWLPPDRIGSMPFPGSPRNPEHRPALLPPAWTMTFSSGSLVSYGRQFLGIDGVGDDAFGLTVAQAVLEGFRAEQGEERNRDGSELVDRYVRQPGLGTLREAGSPPGHPGRCRGPSARWPIGWTGVCKSQKLYLSTAPVSSS